MLIERRAGGRRGGRGGLGSLRSLYYDWLCRLAPLIQRRAWQRESGGAFSRHLWVNQSKGYLKRKRGADNPPRTQVELV